MDETRVRDLLAAVADGRTPVEEALQALRRLPYEDLGFALLDTHRSLRAGFPEVIFCAGKTEEQVAAIAARLAEHSPRLLGTRATPAQYEAARRLVPDLRYHETARALWLDREPERPRQPGVVIAAAGTADLPVAEEAALTLDLMGHAAERVYDVGVAGLHRLRPHLATLQAAHVLVVVAGMEGALPSVIGGLVAAPVIAVPTSVGYGASFGGLAALLAMLNSCAPGVAVVNIDNGFGAGVLAARINALAHRQP
ncbi:MAG: nickel pincer cofactor biosynthesis protein LarB [Anaerolineae bacterium]|nr:nickel pincer cofactor biosynthesis protein LarB [Anaerolineae bacterium]